MIDYVICRKRDMRDVCNVKVLRSAECGTDHFLLRGKLKLHLMRQCRANGVKIPKRVNVSKLNNPIPPIREQLSQAFDIVAFDGSWENFKSVSYTVSTDILGFKQKQHKDWFDNNDPEIDRLLQEKYDIFQKLSSGNAPDPKIVLLWKEKKATLQRKLRKMKNDWWQNLSLEIQ